MKRDIYAEDYKSKSQFKREAHFLHDAGELLIKLSVNQLKTMPVSEHIVEAIVDAKDMQQGALKRQKQYIGRLLREDEDLDLPALERALAAHFK